MSERKQVRERDCRRRLSTTAGSQSTHGFSLIEILSVIAVISILAGLIIAAFGKAQSRARNMECLSNIRQLGLGCLMYANDHGGRLMRTDTVGGTWLFEVASYLGDEDRVLRDINKGVYRCPTAEMVFGAENIPTTYAINSTYNFAPGALLEHATMPHATVLLADGRAKSGGNGYNVKFNSQSHGYYHITESVTNQDSGEASGFFMDGHVALFSREDYQTHKVVNGLDPNLSQSNE